MKIYSSLRIQLSNPKIQPHLEFEERATRNSSQRPIIISLPG